MNPIHYQNAVDLVNAIRNKNLSVTEVVSAHIERIEKYNPGINAIVAMDRRSQNHWKKTVSVL